jgi:hypothetical protein
MVARQLLTRPLSEVVEVVALLLSVQIHQVEMAAMAVRELRLQFQVLQLLMLVAVAEEPFKLLIQQVLVALVAEATAQTLGVQIIYPVALAEQPTQVVAAVLAMLAALVLSSSDTYLQYKESIPSQPLVL